MRRQAFLGFLLLCVTLLVSGCGELWNKPQYRVLLQVQGLETYAPTDTVRWAANNPDYDTVSGSLAVSGAAVETPLSLSSGTWTISVELYDNTGKKLYTSDQELVVAKQDQTVTFKVPKSEEKPGPGSLPPEENNDPAPPDEELPTEPQPGPQWKAWNGDMQPTPTGILKGESNYETPYYIIDSGVPGPVLLVNGGMHGDEPAGSLAAWRLVQYSVKRGKLIVIPEMNRLGLKAGVRQGGYPGDPNRDYPQGKNETADDKLSRSVWQLLQDQHVTWLMDLHEGYSYHKVNSNSVGQSIIHHKGTTAQHTARDKVVNAMIKAANALVSSSQYQFSHLHNPISGSLARAAGDYLGVAAMTIETCDKQSLSLRIKEHETMVSTAMRELGML